MKILKFICAFFAFFTIFGIGYYFIDQNQTPATFADPKANYDQSDKRRTESNSSDHNSALAKSDKTTFMLLGVDRRSKNEGYRTDIMILVSVDKVKNKAVMISVPRDLWWKTGRINATYIQDGWGEMQNAMEEITGLRPEKFVLTDFEDFSWIVDSMGGVPVDVETTFTDSQYPVDATFEYQTVTFTEGKEVLNGERALIFSRSRKGDNDNGDWGRMKRQHLILKGMLKAVKQPSSIFKNMELSKAFDMVTKGRMDTNLALSDVGYLWDLHKDYEKYTISSLYLDYDYLFTPPMEEYGGAWVLAPIGGDSFSSFKLAVQDELNGVKKPDVEAEPVSTIEKTTP